MTSRNKGTRRFEASCVTRLKLLSRTRRHSKVHTSACELSGGVFLSSFALGEFFRM